jgi:hypothetical protein
MKLKARNPTMIAFGLVFLLAAAVIFFFSSPKEEHVHADFALYINGVLFNFSQEKYMSDSNKTLSESVHLHDMNGRIVHRHAAGITLGYFFGTLGIGLNSTCIALDNGTAYCNSGEKSLSVFINGKQTRFYENYVFRDLDRILIAYGNYTQENIDAMISSVSDEACIYSLKCPERGTPPPESCSGGICEE